MFTLQTNIMDCTVSTYMHRTSPHMLSVSNEETRRSGGAQYTALLLSLSLSLSPSQPLLHLLSPLSLLCGSSHSLPFGIVPHHTRFCPHPLSLSPSPSPSLSSSFPSLLS